MNDISYTSMALSYSLILLFALFLYLRRINLTLPIILSSLQGIVQLTAAGFVVLWLFKVDHVWAVSGILFIMCGAATFLTARRWKKYKRMGVLIALVIYLVPPSILIILCLFKVIAWKAQYIIPIGGILIGQVMNNCSFFIERVTFEIEQSKSLIEANLSLGISAKEVIIPLTNRAIKICSMPMVDTLKTLGIIYLPGAMAGLVMAGVNPLVAVKYQLVIIFMLTFAFGFSSISLALGIHKVLFNSKHQLVI
ncbi:ABC transporter permease [bacterium]|nr:ABC transporter permease [bacterium]